MGTYQDPKVTDTENRLGYLEAECRGNGKRWSESTNIRLYNI